MGDKPPISLPDEAIQRITAEEMARFEVRERLRKKKTDNSESKTLKFLNSAFGLFILTTIFVSGVGGLFTWWNQKNKDEQAKTEIEKKLLAEFEWRLVDVDARIATIGSTSDVDVKGAETIMIYRTAIGAPEFQSALPEFKNEHWAGIIIQLDDLGVSENAAQAIVATRDLTQDVHVGIDNHGRGYLAMDYLTGRAKILHLYRDSARKKIFP
jgi:hypothetical protein